MGLDLGIIEFLGKNEKGYLKTKVAREDEWDSTRYAIRHEISKNIQMQVLNSGKYYDMEEYYRPIDFDKAYEWANSLEDNDKEYIINILNILLKNDNYYLEYCY